MTREADHTGSDFDCESINGLGVQHALITAPRANVLCITHRRPPFEASSTATNGLEKRDRQ